ncbi:MAG TPA: Asp-tRNA(Asn)/Glu-tRNA(Gln) amidotransferase subunit GatC [Chloroflexi bacterium]|nr:Asp-tRNA(Asn)/Glu-tRNA(Gln) amidotransferase subunit GatC [Chloroflexota bacterium]
MTLSIEEVEHIAELAKLALTDEEKARYREQLSAILDYFNRLQAIDTDDIPPTATVLPLHTVLRDDVPHPGISREELLANTEHKENGMFRVEAILDESP